MAGNSRDFLVKILADSTQALVEMDGFANKAGKVAAGIGAAWSAVDIGSKLAEGFQEGALRDGARRELEAALGAGSDVARAAGATAGDLWTQGLGASFEDVSASVRAVAQNLGSADELGAGAFEETARQALLLSQVMGEDVTRATAAAASMVKAGLAANAEEAFNVIARGVATGADKAEDLLDTFQEYSVAFAQLGLTSEQSLGLLNQGLEAGARNSDIVADALKEFAIRAQEAMTTAADTKAVEAAQQRLAEARRSGADAAESAAQRIASAEDALSRAQRDQRTAQDALTQARRDARGALADLADQVTNAALDERGATLAVERARRNLDEAMSAKNYDELSVQEAQLAWEKAVRALKDQRERTRELKAEQAAANRAGVEGSHQVREAKQGVLEADRAAIAAQREVAAAQAAAAESAANSARAVAEAATALADASTPKLTAMGAAYAKLGLDGEAIGRRIATGGSAARGALDNVLDALRRVEDPATRAQIAVQLFGTKSEDMQRALYNLDVSTATKGIGDVSGEVDKLSRHITEGLLPGQNAATRSANKWQDELANLPGPLGDIAGKLYAWGPTIAGITSTIAPAIAGLAAWRAAQVAAAATTATGTAVNTGFAASLWAAVAPTLPFVAAVAAIAALGYLIYKNWDGIVDFFGDVWGGITDGAGAVLDWFKDHWVDVLLFMFTGPFGLAAKWVVEHWGAVKDWFGDLLSAIGDKLAGAGRFLIAPFKSGIERVGDWVDWLRDKFAGMADFITGLPGRVKDGLVGLARLWVGTINLLIDAWNSLDPKLSISLPSWLGGYSINTGDLIPDLPNLPIPKLANGGITDGPTLALIGDNPGGRELVAPLPPGADPASLFGPRTVTVLAPIYLDGREVARTVREVELAQAF